MKLETPLTARLLPLLPPREERVGERRAVLLAGWTYGQYLKRPSPQPSPRSLLAGRGRRLPPPVLIQRQWPLGQSCGARVTLGKMIKRNYNRTRAATPSGL